MPQTINDIIDDFVDELRLNNLTDSTIQAYRFDIRRFFRETHVQSIDQVSDQVVKKYVKGLLRAGLKANSVNRRIAPVKRLCELHSIPLTIRYLKTERVLPEYVPADEIIRLLENIRNGFELKPMIRDRAYISIRLMFSTMIRVSELIALTWGDVNFIERNLKIYGKGRKERKVLMDNETTILLQELYERKQSAFVVCNSRGNQCCTRIIQTTLNEIQEKLNLKYSLTPHVLRHSGATALYERGMPLGVIADLLGHESDNTTRIYAKLNVKLLQKSYDLYHPLAQGPNNLT